MVEIWPGFYKQSFMTYLWYETSCYCGVFAGNSRWNEGKNICEPLNLMHHRVGVRQMCPVFHRWLTCLSNHLIDLRMYFRYGKWTCRVGGHVYTHLPNKQTINRSGAAHLAGSLCEEDDIFQYISIMFISVSTRESVKLTEMVLQSPSRKLRRGVRKLMDEVCRNSLSAPPSLLWQSPTLIRVLPTQSRIKPTVWAELLHSHKKNISFPTQIK